MKVQYNFILPVNCISHSLTESICIVERSLRSSYSSLTSFTLKMARALVASLPANALYGPPVIFNQVIYNNKKQRMIRLKY